MDPESSARNLKKGDLGGVIFACKNHAIKECLTKQLFGLPASHFSYVKNIQQGLPLFLFNYDSRKLQGVYEAAGPGQMSIDPYAWTNGGLQRTKYPAQVHVRVRLECHPISEYQFRNILEKNYYAPTRFCFELDHVQVDGLILLFMKYATKSVLPVILPTSASQKTNGVKCKIGHGDQSSPELPATNKVRLSSSSKIDDTSLESKNYSENEWLSSAVPSNTLYGRELIHVSGYDVPADDNVCIESNSVNSELLNEGNEVVDDNSGSNTKESDVILNKLQQLVRNHHPLTSEQSEVESEKALPRSEFNQFMSQIKENFEKLRHFVLDQGHQISILEQKQVQAEKEILDLRKRVEELGSQPVTMSKSVDNPPLCSTEDDSTLDDPSLCLSDPKLAIYLVERVKEQESEDSELITTSKGVDNPPSCSSEDESTSDNPSLCLSDSTEAIYLVGGFDGSSWLSRLDLYVPKSGSILPLQSMSSPRSYAGVASLQNCIYAIGGGDGCSWYDTVEYYDPCSKGWSQCPSLSCEKGCLSAVALDGKIFILGGFNGADYFSDVEMYDPILGRWIIIGSMLHERFSHATAELGGALYVVGGYDGKEYLRSAERYDPREVSWEKLDCMSSRRGCHSLVVLNEKLYALGGYDGIDFLSSAEMYDPRLGSWVTIDPMNTCRGYAAAATLGDSVYIIGGFKDEGQEISDTVECFKEGVGWRMTNSTGIGRRCLHSAAIL